METDSSYWIIAILSDQIRAIIDTVAVSKLLFSYDVLMT